MARRSTSRRRAAPSRRRATSTRRRSARKPTFVDHFMVAGICGGGLYVLLHIVLTVPKGSAAVLGVLAFGFALGASVPVVKYRSPIVRRRRW